MPASARVRQAALWALLVSAFGPADVRADNTGDWYDNRDDGHSNLRLTDHPGAQAFSSGFSVQFDTIEGRIVVGNASLAFIGPIWASLPRGALMDSAGASATWAQYRSNNVYFYPEHRDHDAVDHYHAWLPTIGISQGSSGSEIDECHKWFSALAALPSDVKARLASEGLLMPALQMFWRRTRVDSDEAYLGPLAHGSVFDNLGNGPAMVALAQSMTADALVPLAQIEVLEETYGGTPGVDWFESFGVERHFDTPVSVCRIWRGREVVKRLVVSAASSFDVDGRPLTFHWRVLRGDPADVRIEALEADASRVAIEIDYHEARAIEGTDRRSRLVAVGAFVDNGVWISPPAFVTSFTLASEQRRWDGETGRLARIDYGSDYVFPLLSPPKTWDADEFVYDAAGRLLGWIRETGAERHQFTSQGHLVTEGNLLEGVRAARRVTYVHDQALTEMRWQAGESVPVDPVPEHYRVIADCNGDRLVDISDAIATLIWLFGGDASSPAPACLDGCDADDSGRVELTDAVAILSHLFRGESLATAGTCTLDVTEDSLSCTAECTGA